MADLPIVRVTQDFRAIHVLVVDEELVDRPVAQSPARQQGRIELHADPGSVRTEYAARSFQNGLLTALNVDLHPRDLQRSSNDVV